MSIRPIDLKMAFPKTQEMSKNEQNNQHNLRLSLETKINEQNQTIEQRLKQVNENEELSKSKIEEDEENQQNKNKKNQEEEENKTDSKKNKPEILEASIGSDYNRGVSIDIKI